MFVGKTATKSTLLHPILISNILYLLKFHVTGTWSIEMPIQINKIINHLNVSPVSNKNGM